MSGVGLTYFSDMQVAIDQYAEAALGNRAFFLNKPAAQHRRRARERRRAVRLSGVLRGRSSAPIALLPIGNHQK
jgi:hypothetical protein